MTWTLAAAFLLAGHSAALTADPSLLATPQSETARPAWQLALRVSGPMTTTDPQHVGVSLGVGRAGTYRVGLRYQPAETSPLGFMYGTVGLRLVSTPQWTVAADFEHARVWSARRLYQSGGFQFEGHDRRWSYLGILSAESAQRRWLGVISGIELGGGRMVIRDMVAGRVGSLELNDPPVLVLKTTAPVGVLGIRMSRSLRWQIEGSARVRLIAAGRSRGGVVPFAQGQVEWELARPLFTSSRFGRGYIGVNGNHSTSSRAATYYQNGVGVSLKIAF
jgi:hypothetical protein